MGRALAIFVFESSQQQCLSLRMSQCPSHSRLGKWPSRGGKWWHGIQRAPGSQLAWHVQLRYQEQTSALEDVNRLLSLLWLALQVRNMFQAFIYVFNHTTSDSEWLWTLLDSYSLNRYLPYPSPVMEVGLVPVQLSNLFLLWLNAKQFPWVFVLNKWNKPPLAQLKFLLNLQNFNMSPSWKPIATLVFSGRIEYRLMMLPLSSMIGGLLRPCIRYSKPGTHWEARLKVRSHSKVSESKSYLLIASWQSGQLVSLMIRARCPQWIMFTLQTVTAGKLILRKTIRKP